MISFEYPIWALIICALVALVYAIAMYWRPKYLASTVKKQAKYLAILRFLTVGLICMLILGPILKSYKNEIEKPIAVIAVDKSRSIAEAYDSSDLDALTAELAGIQSQLSNTYDVYAYSFADEINSGLPDTFDGAGTDLSSVLRYISDLFADQNLAATFLLSDGIYNQGQDPTYTNTAINSKVYPILLGDTTIYRDLQIERVFHNRIGYFGDKASIEVDVSATSAQGQSSAVRLQELKDGKWSTVDNQPVKIDGDTYFQTFQFVVSLDQVGLSRFRVLANAIQQEKNKNNNIRDFFIDVIDSRQKILLVAQSPHPDLGVFKKMFDQDERYQMDIRYIKDPKVDTKEYDLLVFHRLPAVGARNGQWNSILESTEKPRLFILGSGIQARSFNALQNVLNIAGESLTPNDVQAAEVKGFTSFNLSQNLAENLTNYPPLSAPYGEFRIIGSTDVLLNQRIGNIETEYPLWLVSNADQTGKIGIIAGEGLWRWQLFDYQQNEIADELSELLSKTIQYLSLKEDKRPFRVFQKRNIYTETDNIIFDAELYNASFERINTPEPTLRMRNEKGDNFDFAFSKTADAYKLDIGRLEAGDYSWTASVNSQGESYTAKGQFGVSALDLETQNTNARKSALKLLASKYGGEVLTIDQVPQIPTILAQDENAGKSLVYRILESRAGIDIRWIFGLILLFLAGEWLWRRLIGSY